MTDKELGQEEFRRELLKEISEKMNENHLFSNNNETIKWIEVHQFVSEFKMPKKKIESIDWDKLKDKFNEITGKKMRVVTAEVKKKIGARLKEGWKKIEIIKAIENSIKDPYHIETNFMYVTLEYISRAKTLEKYQTDPSPKQDKTFEANEEEYDK